MHGVFLDSEGLDDLDLSPFHQECSSLDIHPISHPDEVVARLQDKELAILNKVRMSRQVFEQCPSLKLICVVATGTDVIDLKAAADHGVTVCNCQDYGTDSVVQHVFTTLLALFTNLLPYQQAVREGRWQKSSQFCFLDYPIVELRGKVLGIVGYGTLGRGVARIAEAFGMEVRIARRPGGPVDDRPELHDLLPEVDALTLHCRLTEQTRNLIGSEEFALMKKSAVLINAARGGIVNETALRDALRDGTIAGAAFDVLSTEPPTDDNVLLQANLPNLILTPHIAWASREARSRIIAQTAENIRMYRAGTAVRQVA